MQTIDEYLASLTASDRDAVARVYAIASDAVADAVQGQGYGMPALVYRGRPLISVMRAKAHFGVYPFSAGVVAGLADGLAAHVAGKGTIRFTPDDPLTEEEILDLVTARRDEIDSLS